MISNNGFTCTVLFHPALSADHFLFSVQVKGHAVSRLLQSFSDDGFHVDEESSFSEGDDDEEEEKQKPPVHLPPNMPCRIPGSVNDDTTI